MSAYKSTSNGVSRGFTSEETLIVADGSIYTSISFRSDFSAVSRKGTEGFSCYRGDNDMQKKKRLKVNASLTLAGIPPEALEYRLGNRSALDWVIDQYQVHTDKRSGITSDPNRAEDEQYIVRLVGQVIRVSVETVAIVNALPAEFANA